MDGNELEELEDGWYWYKSDDGNVAIRATEEGYEFAKGVNIADLALDAESKIGKIMVEAINSLEDEDPSHSIVGMA